jgi:hypothetical protein
LTKQSLIHEQAATPYLNIRPEAAFGLLQCCEMLRKYDRSELEQFFARTDAKSSALRRWSNDALVRATNLNLEFADGGCLKPHLMYLEKVLVLATVYLLG